MNEITKILNQMVTGQLDRTDQLLPLVYNELRAMASAKMAHERPGQLLDATGLVNEAYLRLRQSDHFESRKHFFGAAAEAMRRILIDQARSEHSNKRGGGIVKIQLEDANVGDATTSEPRLEALNVALDRFEEVAPDKAELVKLRYFVGLTIREAAEIIGISVATANRHWAFAKAWLQRELQ
ncbi:MAG: ECF-type sigma factor [Planctomycetota bacterium]